MEAEVTSKVKKGFGRKIPKWAVISFVVFLILCAAALLYFFKFNSHAKTAVKQQTTKVMKGDLSVTVTGSGPIISSSRVDVSSNETAAITKVYFKEGDTVKAGDLMFELDDTDARSNVEKIQDSISQTELSQRTDASNLSKLTITAPFSGRVTGVTVKSGDVLGKNASIFTLTDQSKLKLTVPFNGASSIKPGQKATVYIQSLMQSVEGTVSYVSEKAYSTSAGGQIHDIDITINNPGGLSDGMKANAEVSTAKGSLSSTDNGTLTYENSTAIRTQTGGTVSSVNVKENQYVYGGDVLLQLSGDDLSTAKQTDDLKRQDLQIQMDTAQKQLSYYKIFAPIDGTIVKLDVSAGDAAKAGEVLATVANSSKMEFTIPVDELDIAKIAVGQKTNITVDALTDTSTKPLTGSVSKIALEGTSTNGVTTYPVTVQINETDKLKGGMNANAEIIVNQKTNTLYIPIEAVQKMGNRTFVMVQTDEKTAAASRTQQGSRAGAGGAGQYGAGSGAGGNSSGGANSGNSNRASGGGNSGNANRTAGGSNGGGYGQNGGTANRAATGNAASSAARSNNAQSSYYANAIMKPVEVGISNDTYIEITSGLQQSDIIILPPVSSTAGTGANANRAGGGFGGGSGGFGGGGGGIGMTTRAAGR